MTDLKTIEDTHLKIGETIMSMIDQQTRTEIATSRVEKTPTSWNIRTPSQRLLVLNETFTRSNGTIIARIYERLTKASRRRIDPSDPWNQFEEEAYRQGVYDAYKALQEELS